MTNPTKARKRNDAFSGDQITQDGRFAFYVFYRDMKAVKALRKLQKRPYPPGHVHALRVGWMWIKSNDRHEVNGKSYGPFASSREAYQQALMTLAERVA